jgi:hypothetical protein
MAILWDFLGLLAVALAQLGALIVILVLLSRPHERDLSVEASTCQVDRPVDGMLDRARQYDSFDAHEHWSLQPRRS